MSIKKFPLEAYGAAVSREELVQAALDEITKNYREASLSNVARSYGVSLAYVSECVRAQTGRTYKELLQKHRMETAARLLRRSALPHFSGLAFIVTHSASFFHLKTSKDVPQTRDVFFRSVLKGQAGVRVRAARL